MKQRRQLFHWKSLYAIKDTDALFLGAMQEMIRFHEVHCKEYADILRSQSFQVKALHDMKALSEIPVLPTMFLKQNPLFTIPETKRILRASSSGTSGQKSQVALDCNTIVTALPMLQKTFSYHNMFSWYPTNYIVLGYEPNKENQMGAVRSMFGATWFAPALHRTYALKYIEGKYELNLDGVLNAVSDCAKKGQPLRMIGFPAYLLLLLEALEREGKHFSLHPRSMIILAGGWKGFWRQKTDKTVLYEKAKRLLQIDSAQFRDVFAPVEHPISYCTCKNHNFHVPIYSRVLIRDVDTLLPVAHGTPGLLNLLSPMVRSMPVASIMTDDLAILYPGDACGCGIDAPFFKLLGRAGVEQIRTCAMQAEEVLKGGG